MRSVVTFIRKVIKVTVLHGEHVTGVNGESVCRHNCPFAVVDGAIERKRRQLIVGCPVPSSYSE